MRKLDNMLQENFVGRKFNYNENSTNQSNYKFLGGS
jgi:hypothetical protein